MPTPLASPAVEAVLAEASTLAAKLPQNWCDAVARLCDDARQIGTVEHAVMIRNCVAVFCRPGPVTISKADLLLDPEPEPLPPDPEFIALLAEGRELAVHLNPIWMKELDRQVAWSDLASMRKCLRGLREMASLRKPD